MDDVAVTCEVTEQSTVDDARSDVVLNLLPAQLEKLSRRLTTRGKVRNHSFRREAISLKNRSLSTFAITKRWI